MLRRVLVCGALALVIHGCASAPTGGVTVVSRVVASETAARLVEAFRDVCGSELALDTAQSMTAGVSLTRGEILKIALRLCARVR